MSPFKKNIIQFFFLIITAVIIYGVANIFGNYQNKNALTLEQLWSADIKKLSENNFLPLAWNEIKFVEKNAAENDSIAETWKNKISAPIQVAPEGQYKLEVLFISQESENQTQQALIQLQIVTIESKNTVWELTRTYDLNE